MAAPTAVATEQSWKLRPPDAQDQERPVSFTSSTGSFHSAWELFGCAIEDYYDTSVGRFFGFGYDILQLSSGRDKLCAFAQGYAELASQAMSRPGSERQLMFLAVEENIGDGRKIFRLFKEVREIYKIRRGFHRLQQGVASEGPLGPSTCCGVLDVLAHTASFFFFLYDNLLWAASVGILATKETPRWYSWGQGPGKDGALVASLNGVSGIKRKKDKASILRLLFAIVANVILLRQATVGRPIGGGKQGSLDDPRLFHTLELVGMAASGRILLSRLGFTRALGRTRAGMLSMLAAACGLWSSWRKIKRKQKKPQRFSPMLRPAKLPPSPPRCVLDQK